MITVEEANSTDLDPLVELESALFLEDAGVHDPHADTTWPQREGHEDFAQLIASDDCLLLVASHSNETVGFLAGYATPSSPTRQPVEYAILRSLYVAASVRRLGAASTLTARFIDWARDRGCVEAHVDHYANNTGAGELYARIGFIPRSISRTLTL